MKTFLTILGLFMVVAMAGCSKGSDVVPVVPAQVLTKFPPPAWKADETGKYPFSMTAAVVIPAELQANVADGDQLAAFINGECRGEGVKVKVAGNDVFFVLIHGLADEQSKISFKYYSVKSSYMYQTSSVLSFLVDDVYGTAQNPKVLDLTQIK